MSPRWQSLLHADPWAREPLDLPSLNASASAAIEQAIEQIRAAARAEPTAARARSLVVLGPAGTGKTHLFARLRRRLGRCAAFALVRPLLGASISPRYLLMHVVEQLARESAGVARIPPRDGSGRRPVSQLDAMLGSVAADVLPDSSAAAAGEIDQIRPSSSEEQDERIDRLVEGLLDRWPQADDSYLRLLLRTPFAPTNERRALLGWLSGRDLDEAQLARIGLRESLSEQLVMPALKTLGAMAARRAPMVLVLDQLENLIDSEDEGRVRSYGNLVSELVDEVPGIVIVQMVLDSEWQRGIEPALSASQRTRVAMEIVRLALPTVEEREGLLRLWARHFGQQHEDFPAPFGERRVRAWCTEAGMTPRMLLIACSRVIVQDPAEAGAGVADEPVDDTADEADRRERRADALAEAWQNELARARGLLDEAGELSRPVEAELLGDALGAAIGLVPGMQGSSNPHGPLVGLTVQADGERVRVAMVARSHPRSVLALLDAIIRVTEHARVLVVRERAHELRPTWRACLQRRERLVGSANASWLDLERDDVTKLLALQGLLSNARSRDLTDAEGRPLPFEVVRKWAQSSLGVEGWAPIRAVRELAGRGGTAQDNGPPPGKKPVRNARADPSAVDDAPMPSAAPRDLVGASAGGADGLASMDTGPKGSAIGVLRQLRVASLERLVRESARIHGACSRHDVLTELDGAGERVQWFGRSIVAIREEP